MKNKMSLGVALLPFLIYGVLISCWCVNVYKFLKCDFEPSFREEIIHAVGVFIPPLSVVTCWF